MTRLPHHTAVKRIALESICSGHMPGSPRWRRWVASRYYAHTQLMTPFCVDDVAAYMLAPIGGQNDQITP